MVTTKILHKNYPGSQLLGFSNGEGFAPSRWAIPQVMAINFGQNIYIKKKTQRPKEQSKASRHWKGINIWNKGMSLFLSLHMPSWVTKTQREKSIIFLVWRTTEQVSWQSQKLKNEVGSLGKKRATQEECQILHILIFESCRQGIYSKATQILLKWLQQRFLLLPTTENIEFVV